MARKYGRTYHFPFSPGGTKDDKIISDMSILTACEDCVSTEKMDGECTTIHRAGTHARSPDGRYHPSRAWMKAFAAGISPQMASDEKIVGEYLYAQHSIRYDDLPSYFMGFAWIVNDVFQSWDDTTGRFAELGILSVPVLYRGPYSESAVAGILNALDFERQEGFVCRTAESFHESQMSVCMGKYVRAGHVQTDKHWMHQEIKKNGLSM